MWTKKVKIRGTEYVATCDKNGQHPQMNGRLVKLTLDGVKVWPKNK